MAGSLLFGANALAGDSAAQRVDGAWASETTTVSVEGGFFYNESDSNVAFDPDAEDKLGDLDALGPGDDGWQMRVDLNHTIDPLWDTSAGLVFLGFYESETSFFGVEAEQDLAIGLADVAVGYHAQTDAAVDLRYFGGLRGLYASNEASWSEFEVDKHGAFDDETWSIGPRAGVDLVIPINPLNGIDFVGSVSAAALFGSRQREIDYVDNEDSGNNFSTSNSDLKTIWNFEAMAGLNRPIGENTNFTLGYRAQSFHNLVAARSNIQSDGSYVDDSDSDVIIHGPFVRLTVPLDSR